MGALCVVGHLPLDRAIGTVASAGARRVAALHHELTQDPVVGEAVIEALVAQSEEVPRRDGGQARPHGEGHGPYVLTVHGAAEGDVVLAEVFVGDLVRIGEAAQLGRGHELGRRGHDGCRRGCGWGRRGRGLFPAGDLGRRHGGGLASLGHLQLGRRAGGGGGLLCGTCAALGGDEALAAAFGAGGEEGQGGEGERVGSQTDGGHGAEGTSSKLGPLPGGQRLQDLDRISAASAPRQERRPSVSAAFHSGALDPVPA